MGATITPSPYIVGFPILILLMGMIGLGLGMIISSLVTKYRDLSFLVAFGVQLLMYLSAVMYPISLIKEKLVNTERGIDYAWIIDYNPMAQIIEMGRYMLLNEGTISIRGMLYTVIVSFLILITGILVFNKTEKSFIDTI